MKKSFCALFFLYSIILFKPGQSLGQCGSPGVDNAAAGISCSGSSGSVWLQFSPAANSRQAQAILVPAGTTPTVSTPGWVNATQSSVSVSVNVSGSYDLYVRWSDCSTLARVEPGWFGGSGSSYVSSCSGNSGGTSCSVNATIASAGSPSCQSVNLNASVGTNPADVSYEWFENSVLLGSGTSLTLNNVSAGSHLYKLTVTKNGCANSPSSITSNAVVVSQCSTGGGGASFVNMGTNVGINMNNSGQSLAGLGSYALAVNGKMIANEIRVRIGWADYVFDDNYKLMPLKDVNRFIKRYKHLPGISSADVVERNGIDLGETNRILLEKIEEITLRLIMQRKQINALQAQLKTL